MRLVLSTAWFPVCVGVYLLRAARRAGHDVMTVGPSWHRMPWPDADPTTDWSEFVVTPDILFDERGWVHTTTENPWERLGRAELWIDVHGGWFWQCDTGRVRRVLVATDPHVPAKSWSYEPLRPLVDRVFVMQRAQCRDGDVWLPYAYDPEWHRDPGDVAEDHDVCMIGAAYPERDEIAAYLRAEGVRVLGPGRGPIGPAYARELCHAPLCAVWPMADDIPARVFEALACRRAVVTTCVPGMQELCLPAGTANGIGRLGPGLDAFTHEGPRSPERFARHVLDVVRGEDAYGEHGLLAAVRQCAGSLCPGETWDARLDQLIGDSV